MRARERIAVLSSYVAVFVLLELPWLVNANHATSFGHDARDSRLIVWILHWASTALTDRSAILFNAPIFHPSPDQLALSEHFLTYQLLFSPTYWLSGNALLAANLVAASTYPLAAWLMHCLLTVLGLSWPAAWVGGLVFALSAERVPASLQVLQYGNFFLPLCALGLVRLHAVPIPRRSVELFVAYSAALFSSYYMAVIATLFTALWFGLEIWWKPRNAAPFLRWTVGATVIAVTILAMFSAPYFRQREILARSHPPSVRSLSEVAKAEGRADPRAHGQSYGPGRLNTFVRLMTPNSPAASILVLVGIIFGCLYRRSFLVATGSLFVVAGIALTLGGGTVLHTIFPSVLGFWRSPFRYLMLSRFGFAVLAGTGAEGLRASLPPKLGLAAIGLAVVAVLYVPGARLVPSLDEIRAFSDDKRIYQSVAQITHGEGALLEMPLVFGPLRDGSADAMAGATIHHRPLILGYSGYPTSHLPLVRQLVHALQAERSDLLDDLVDLTHLRWILVRPSSDWRSGSHREQLLERLAAYPEIGPRFDLGGGWILQRVDRVPQHRDWFSSIAKGDSPGRSILGTPLSALPRLDGRLSLALADNREHVPPRSAVRVRVDVSNDGDLAWPVASAYGVPTPGQVFLQPRWIGPAGAFPVRPRELLRDIPPGESSHQTLIVPTPREPGHYELELSLQQRAAPPGEPPEPLRAWVSAIVDAPSKPGR
jgi:hypothetical protein